MTTTAEHTQTAGYSDDAPTVVCNLEITGMTCASCVRRIEKSLNNVDGVAGAQVNLATEVATVTYDPNTVGLDELIGAVTAVGYGVTPRPETDKSTGPGAPAAATSGGQDTAERDRDTMDWLMPAIFVVATVIQYWAGRSIYAGAWQAAKHRSTNMTTLVALGTGVAWTYSTFVTLWPAQVEQLGLPLHVYYETSLIIVALVLAGKWMEATASGWAPGRQPGGQLRVGAR